MAMSKESMMARIRTNLVARNTNLNAPNIAILEPYLEDICDGIIEEIKENMELMIKVENVQPGAATIIGTKQAVT